VKYLTKLTKAVAIMMPATVITIAVMTIAVMTIAVMTIAVMTIAVMTIAVMMMMKIEAAVVHAGSGGAFAFAG
jgi:hypothetical protein